ncbi:MAG: undecaprenyldiphospho-muramoylpentapeptide beta-N-acetylglucosaminyltransferase [Clostridiales bacterium]|nr:undecaprenyldiphospho-muramoylpentapeptide beta-N-acetylglucosaminyltransferase [Clostridiales bacterium]
MRVLIAAGGTGGHIYPALALARYLHSREQAEILFVGTQKGMEKDIIPDSGFSLEMIPVVGLERRLSLQMGRAVFLAFSGLRAARQVIKRFRPDIVVGVGGYVSGPVVLAAALAKIPTVIHEQNAIPGLTNVLLSRVASSVCLSIPGSERHFPRPGRTVLTGNPRASEAVAADGKDTIPTGLLPGVPLLLCVGGSHGAARLNEAFTDSIAKVLSACDAQVVYVTGKRYFAEVSAKLAAAEVRFPKRLHIIPYHPALPELLTKTSLMVSRAGATTLAEVTALGVPAVLVPSPNVTNNHQEYNARMLSDHGAAVLIKEEDLTSALLTELLTELLKNIHRLREMSDASRSLGFPDAAERMAAVLRELA